MQIRWARWLEQPVGSRAERAAYFAAFVLLVAARLPDILLKGRFWAEEGNVFFVTAWLEPWWKALLAPYGGYLDLVPNIGALVAYHLLPLSAAPYGSSAVALLVQCIPAVLILCSRQDWLQPRLVMIAALLLTGMAVAAEEVWISTLGATAHLALATALILALDVPRAGLLRFQFFVLLLAALTAPGAWILAVLFFARAAVERSKGRALQGIVLLVGIILQLAFFFSQFGRTITIAPSLFGAVVFVKNVLVPLLGVPAADRIVPRLASLYSEQGGPIWPLLLSASLFALVVALAVRQVKQAPVWFLLAGAVIATTGYVGAFEPFKLPLVSTLGASRYAVAPQILIGLALLSWSRTCPDWTRYAAGALTAWLLLIDLTGYIHTSARGSATGPAWRDEVVAWRRDPQHLLQLWPPGWTVELPPTRLPPVRGLE